MLLRTLAAAGLCALLAAIPQQSLAGKPMEYPATKTVDQVDDYHGTEVADPYRWLEDVDSEETEAWVKAQNEVTFDYLETLPARGAIESRLSSLWDYPKYSTPFREGGKTFWFKNDGL